ncbi:MULTISPECIES: hypothetical protein [unclassified Wolbachia]|uniref:hypothetical protein n=1 Tax=unclassified Wolbachia TaxID=2640676 RepID=UPI0022210C91|nr:MULTISPECIES: hypothetical protein [unclassified Wolbachia]MDX5496231.1 hypothetical protein [Wolbachia endosymbiont of Nomada fabriciana]MDX5507735.1 hypothetical protein [Wolbachia endosymbiont of Hylaeus sinuatus]
MVELTDAQEEILGSLRQAVRNDNFQEVQNVLDNKEHNDIQAVLSHEGTLTSDKGTILNDVIDCSNASVNTKVEIIELIWQKADQKTHDFLCDYKVTKSFEDQPYFTDTIDDLKRFQGKFDPHSTEYFALARVVQKIEDHKWVMDLDMALRRAIRSLNVDQVKTALENCGEDVESVLTRNVYWSDATDIDCLLIYPLMVDYERNLGKEEFEKIKEITKLLWDKASPDVRNFWLEDHMVNREGQNTEDNYIIGSLEKQQKEYANIAGEGWLEDFIQEVKGYKKDREIKLNEYKGKIALGVVGLCVVGAIAAYVLAYPVVALVLEVSAVSALAVLAYIGGVCEKSESPNTKSLNPVVSGCCNNAELPNQ